MKKSCVIFRIMTCPKKRSNICKKKYSLHASIIKIERIFIGQGINIQRQFAEAQKE